MEKHIFNKFCTELVEHGLKSSKRMSVEEMVAMFLVIVGHGVGNRMIQERFQHSGETVSRHFHRVHHACLKLSFKYIKPEDPMFRDCHAKVKDDQRYWPFLRIL
jgi:site-specific recombinase XerC